MAFLPFAISAGTSLLGGLLGSSAAKKSGKILNDAGIASANQVNDTTRSNQEWVSGATSTGVGQIDKARFDANQALESGFNRQSDQLNPYLEAGRSGITTLQQAMQPGGDLSGKFAAPSAAEAAATPGFQFQFDQGQKAIQRAASAAGGLGSGGTLKASAQYGQGLASTYYQNAFNNALNVFNTNRNATLGNIMQLTDLGKVGLGQYNQASMNYGNQTAGNLMSAGSQMANLGLGGAEFNANLGARGAEAAGNFRMQGAGGQAAAIQGSGNAWQNALGQTAYSAGRLLTPGAPPPGAKSPYASVYQPSGGPNSGGGGWEE